MNSNSDVSLDVVRQQRFIQTLNADQQQKYLHLQEQTELLLQQLREMKRQRQQLETCELVPTFAS